MDNHLTQIETLFTEDTYLASCSCGWSGRRAKSERDAGVDAANHVSEKRVTETASQDRHTPGPWRVEDPARSVMSRGIGIWADEWGYVAYVDAGSPDEANALLIAAAPELLEALKALCDIEDPDDKLVRDGLAAIKKATGR